MSTHVSFRGFRGALLLSRAFANQHFPFAQAPQINLHIKVNVRGFFRSSCAYTYISTIYQESPTTNVFKTSSSVSISSTIIVIISDQWSNTYYCVHVLPFPTIFPPKALSSIHRGQTRRLQCPLGSSSTPYIEQKLQQLHRSKEVWMRIFRVTEF